MDPRRILPTGEPPTGQVAFVTHDLESTARRWLELGIGPWRIWTFDQQVMRQMRYRGAPARFAARLALCSIGPATYELIEPTIGPSVWQEFLDTRGEGFHHLGYYVDDIGDAIDAMEARGYPAAQTAEGFGVDGDGAFAYFDTLESLGCYMEAIVGPRALAAPEAVIS